MNLLFTLVYTLFVIMSLMHYSVAKVSKVTFEAFEAPSAQTHINAGRVSRTGDPK